MENREQQLREEAEKHCSGYNHGIRDQLINICVDFAKSEAAKQYHSDAVEFAEWIILNQLKNNIRIDEDQIWVFFKSAHGTRLTTEQLYNQFKNK